MTTDPLVSTYLEQLTKLGRALPKRERSELVMEIKEHIAASLGPDATESQVRTLLKSLGDPSTIVSAALPARELPRRGGVELVALLLLLIPIFPPFSWVVGAVLLVRSKMWSARQKALGLFVWPGGYTGILFGYLLFGPHSKSDCTSTVSTAPTRGHEYISKTCQLNNSNTVHLGHGTAIAALTIYALVPVFVAIYLYRAAGKTNKH